MRSPIYILLLLNFHLFDTLCLRKQKPKSILTSLSYSWKMKIRPHQHHHHYYQLQVLSSMTPPFRALTFSADYKNPKIRPSRNDLSSTQLALNTAKHLFQLHDSIFSSTFKYYCHQSPPCQRPVSSVLATSKAPMRYPTLRFELSSQKMMSMVA